MSDKAKQSYDAEFFASLPEWAKVPSYQTNGLMVEVRELTDEESEILWGATEPSGD